MLRDQGTQSSPWRDEQTFASSIQHSGHNDVGFFYSYGDLVMPVTLYVLGVVQHTEGLDAH